MQMTKTISSGLFEKPLHKTVADTARLHRTFWGETFWKTWENMSFDNKLVWFLVINHTIAILTLIEFLVLKK